jgi:glycosyltransferase involved in cell wall biosynthesis
MKVVQVAGWHFPDSTGGTEVYVDGLATGLAEAGVDSVVAAPADDVERDYIWNGTPVHRYHVPPTRDIAEVRGRKRHGAFDRFQAWLQSQHADVYHQHSWTRGCGRHHLEAARSLGLRTVVTVHVPSLICLRGTMLERGREACDGRIGAARCGSCWAGSRTSVSGIPALVGLVPDSVSRWLANTGAGGAVGSALAGRALAEQKRADVLALGSLADRVVAVCGWLRDALLANGLDPEHVVLSRQGVAAASARATVRVGRDGGPLRVGYLGRITSVKGLDVLVRAALKAAEQCQLELYVAGATQNAEDVEYLARVRAESDGCGAIHWVGALDAQQRDAFLAGIDILAVPSVLLETGPLVVLEAYAVGVPVLGADLGGIAELVTHGRDGLLVRHGDVSSWTQELVHCARDRELLAALRSGIRPVRTTGEVVQDMLRVYRDISE